MHATLNDVPLVSVIVVSWNRRERLRKCLRSVMAQSYRHIEVVVIDNASTDGSAEMVREEFPLVKLIQLDRNVGCPGGRNIGVLNSTGQILFFLDDDCYADAEAVKTLVERFANDDAVSIIVPRIIEFGRPCPLAGDPEGRIERYLPVFYGTSSIIRRSVFGTCGLYPTDFVYGGEESDLALRLLYSGGRILYSPAATVYHAPAKNRDANWELRQRLLNSVKTLWKYAPWSRALAGTIAKPLEFLCVAWRKNCLRGWLRAVIGIPFLILRTVHSQREPLGWYPFLLQELLSREVIISWDQVSPERLPSSWLRTRLGAWLQGHS